MSSLCTASSAFVTNISLQRPPEHSLPIKCSPLGINASATSTCMLFSTNTTQGALTVMQSGHNLAVLASYPHGNTAAPILFLQDGTVPGKRTMDVAQNDIRLPSQVVNGNLRFISSYFASAVKWNGVGYSKIKCMHQKQSNLQRTTTT